MCLMSNILHRYLDMFVLLFIDEILVYSRNEEKKKEHLKLLLQTLRENKLYGKLSKCEFFKGKTQYLGHVISKEELSVDPEKIDATMKWPILKYISIIHSFMGIFGY